MDWGIATIHVVMVALMGLCVGSFLNAAIWRLPKEKTMRGRSRCPQCNHVIPWYDNIPLLSYLCLKGKCRYCRGKISFRYFLVEALTAAGILLLFIRYGYSFYFLKYTLLLSILILTSCIDIDYHTIPSSICPVGIIVALGLGIYESLFIASTPDIGIVGGYFQGMIIGAGTIYLLKLFGDEGLAVYLQLRKKDSIEGETEAMGLGDVDFMAMIGAFLGWKIALLAFFIAPFLAMIYGAWAILLKRSHLIPYLPYLSAGVVIAFVWHAPIVSFFTKGWNI